MGLKLVLDFPAHHGAAESYSEAVLTKVVGEQVATIPKSLRHIFLGMNDPIFAKNGEHDLIGSPSKSPDRRH